MPCIVKKSIMWTAPGWQCLCAIENSSFVFPHVSPMFWQEDKDVMPVCIRSTTGTRGGSSAHDLCSDLVTFPLCQSSCRADRIGTFGGAGNKQWLGTDRRTRTG